MQLPYTRSANDSTTNTATRRRVLRGAAGVGSTVAALPLLSGGAAAHFPHQLEIDVQPENAENFVDLEHHETVPVAVFPTEYLNGDGERETFDPTEAPVRYRFGSRYALGDGSGARPVGNGEVREVGGHGGSREALVLEFPVTDTGLDGEEETAWLYWERGESGEHGLAGVDAVKVYGEPVTRQDLYERLQSVLTEPSESEEDDGFRDDD